MMQARGWTWALLSASVLGLLLLGLTRGVDLRSGVAAAIIVAVFVAWVLAPRPPGRSTGHDYLVAILAIVVVATLTGLESSLAIYQAFMTPLIWCLVSGIAPAIMLTVLEVLAVFAGSVLGRPITLESLYVDGIVEGCVLVFSIIMGLWVTHIVALGERQGRLLAELTAAQSELAVLHRDSGAVAERERLARELHDTIAQRLTGLVLLAQRSRRELGTGTLTDEPLELIESGARDALTETRTLVAAGARVELTGGGLADALRALAERFERESGVRVVVEAHTAALPRDAEVVLLRCVQEALANVRKHAAASAVRIRLAIDARMASVEVVDDGGGYDPATARDGFGLTGLRERLRLVGGELELDGTAGATSLRARLPLGGAPADDGGAP